MVHQLVSLWRDHEGGCSPRAHLFSLPTAAQRGLAVAAEAVSLVVADELGQSAEAFALGFRLLVTLSVVADVVASLAVAHPSPSDAQVVEVSSSCSNSAEHRQRRLQQRRHAGDAFLFLPFLVWQGMVEKQTAVFQRTVGPLGFAGGQDAQIVGQVEQLVFFFVLLQEGIGLFARQVLSVIGVVRLLGQALGFFRDVAAECAVEPAGSDPFLVAFDPEVGRRRASSVLRSVVHHIFDQSSGFVERHDGAKWRDRSSGRTVLGMLFHLARHQMSSGFRGHDEFIFMINSH